MAKIIIATRNSKKLSEIEVLMKDSKLEFCSQLDFDLKSCDEPYDTFIENALAKARYASKNTGLPAIADDSGICVDILKGKPGIHSARYAGKSATDEKNIKTVHEVKAKKKGWFN